MKGLKFTVQNEDTVCRGVLRDFGAVDLKILSEESQLHPPFLLKKHSSPAAYRYQGDSHATKARVLIGSPLTIIK